MGWMNTREAMGKLLPMLLKGQFFYDFDTVPLQAHRLSWRKRFNLLLCGLDMVGKRVRLLGMPPTIQIEPSNLCNLACPLCSANSAEGRAKGNMSLEMFNAILDEIGSYLVSVVLYNSGEPFINKNMPQMIAACTARDILTLTSTNGHFIQTLDEALAIVDAGLSAIIIALDGSTQEIYQVYRRCGDIEKVKRCAALLEQAKAMRNSAYPYTNLRTVVMKQNQDDLANIEKIARELGVNMVSFKTLGSATFEDYKQYECDSDQVRRYRYQDGQRRRTKPIRCPYPFRQPSIFWNGALLGCQRDYEQNEAFGKLGEQPFVQMWNGSKAIELRSKILFGSERPPFCARCRSQNRVRDNILASIELRPLPKDKS